MSKAKAIEAFCRYTNPRQVNVKVWLEVGGTMESFLRFGQLKGKKAEDMLKKLQSVAKQL